MLLFFCFVLYAKNNCQMLQISVAYAIATDILFFFDFVERNNLLFFVSLWNAFKTITKTFPILKKTEAPNLPSLQCYIFFPSTVFFFLFYSKERVQQKPDHVVAAVPPEPTHAAPLQTSGLLSDAVDGVGLLAAQHRHCPLLLLLLLAEASSG